MRLARMDDVDALMDLMAEFYAESGYVLERARAEAAFRDVIADSRLGFVWLIEADGLRAGHLVLTLRYAMEYGGPIACLDDLYVRPSFRNRGLSTNAVRDAIEFCRARGIRAMTVEAGGGNDAAQKVYRRAGFLILPDRQILALPLMEPTHVV